MVDTKKLFGEDKMYSLKDLVSILGITRPTLNTILEKQLIGHYKIGQRYFVSQDQLEAYIEKHRFPAKETV